MEMFGIGFTELILILIVALIVFGPSKLPELAASVGKVLRELKRVTDDVKQTIETEINSEETTAENAGTGAVVSDPIEIDDYTRTTDKVEETARKDNPQQKDQAGDS